ncbi:Leucine-rich repeat serine/threonine-protein kinase 2, partial [Phlyctochytrium planicorne]
MSTIASFNIDPSAVTNLDPNPIATSPSADVRRASYNGSAVVLKRLKNTAGSTDHAAKDVQSEIAVLSKLSHANIVRFHGIMKDPSGLSLVMEDMNNGSLLAYYKDQLEPPLDDRMRWALEIARGIQHLHQESPPILHRDLRSLNVLLSEDVNGNIHAKVSDYGAAVMKLASKARLTTKGQGSSTLSFIWRAPELHTIRAKFTAATDIYALGIIFSELISWEGPFGCPWNEINPQYIEAQLLNGKAIPLELDHYEAPQEWKDIAMKCCSGSPKDRPLLQDVIDVLVSLLPPEPLMPPTGNTVQSVEVQTPKTLAPERISTNAEFERRKKEAESGNVESQLWMGNQLKDGNKAFNVDTNPVEAFKWFQMAAEKGNSEAEERVGDMYREGKGVEQNQREGFKWYLKAVRQGNASVENKIGNCYLKGEGISKSVAEGVKWIKRAADKADAEAQCDLGRCYFEGLGVPKDHAMAMIWFAKAGFQDLARGKKGMGDCFITQNPQEAFKWYLKAANQGSGGVISTWQKKVLRMPKYCILGICHLEGKIIPSLPKDLNESRRWLDMAAKQNSPEALTTLAHFHQNGVSGVELDVTKAFQLFLKAAELGGAEAQH